MLTSGDFVPLAAFGILSLSGEDRLSFLQSFCTNDLRKLELGHGCEAFITSVQGKTLGHVFVLHDGETLQIVSLAANREVLHRHLDRYVIREQVTIQDVSNEFVAILVEGTVVQTLGLGQPLRHAHLPLDPPIPISEMGWWIRLPLSTPWALCLVPGSYRESIVASLANHGMTRCGLERWERARIESSFPLYGVDITDDNLPQEVGRDRKAISFTKGCYLGQETVARIDALGHVNRCRVLLTGETDTLPSAGTELFALVPSSSLGPLSTAPTTPPPTAAAGKSVGKVTSSCLSENRGCTLAMAYVRRDSAAPGTELTWNGITCHVAELDRVVRAPMSEDEFVEIYDLRWRVLRAPWQQPRGSEQDEQDSHAVHLAVWGPDGELVGAGRLHWNNAEEAQIRYMAVEEKARGRDVGRDLVMGLEAAARRQGTLRIALQAREEVQGFYEKMGYSFLEDGPTLFDSIRHVKMIKILPLSCSGRT